jgi:Fungal chitosanase of glycosyl hydrolase group 75
MAHTPPGLSVLLLMDIRVLFDHSNTREIAQNFVGKEFMCKFPSGQLYFESKLALDTDGSPVYAPLDRTGQLQTAVKLADGTDLDADVINYFVLPGLKSHGTFFFAHHGIRKGDIGIVIHGIRMAFACFGDVGPSGSLGEGSISLHRELGNETIRGRETASGGTLTNRGINRGVITIVFPGSGNGFGRTNLESAGIGLMHFQRLQREATVFKQQVDQSLRNLRNAFIPSILR